MAQFVLQWADGEESKEVSMRRLELVGARAILHVYEYGARESKLRHDRLCDQ